ncbi:hypothetical protein MCOR27_002042 [Pyricularia oryzae]|uniref:Uncharacterized protein n=2 Tax=Pyricularia TaxID=48558 RepID=A0ABQ8NMJ3_PYRGI|nr:hypothetical protein MCOR01_003788 [Pyricularia oryzae]KAI6299197.1 hypothetical protein MCOR33_004844 [Pyricularia grisea]KAH9427312.1 hypothetical protein MCOR02_012218 [Pyricularia oryzae]KAI6260694.1 hypothetical protein MCOR19_003040 [Pyricularia oryzae]KAI6276176.1 hypothetical protein MCOR26_005731 [Pyricularia oryzae]
MKFPSIFNAAVVALAICSDVVLSEFTSRELEFAKQIHGIANTAKLTVKDMKGMDTIPKGDDADDISKGISDFAGHYQTFFMTMSDVSQAGRIGIDDQIYNDLQADKADLDAFFARLIEVVPSASSLKANGDGINRLRERAVQAWKPVTKMVGLRSLGRASRQARRV